MSSEFRSIQVSHGTMIYNVHKIIKKAKINVDELKDFIRSCTQHNSDLQEYLDTCSDVSSVLRQTAKEEYSLIDVWLLNAVIVEFEVTEAERYIEKYKSTLEEFCKSSPLALCLKEKFAAADSVLKPPLRCEEAIYIFDWKPEKKTLKDIRDILSKSSGRLVKIRFIDTGCSVIVTCTFHYPLLGVLIAKVMENLQLLKDNDLIKLTIGYWTVWEKEKMSHKVRK